MRNLSLFVGYLFCVSEAANILAVLPCPSRSHHIWNYVFLDTLASRGHQIVALTPFPENEKPNLRFVSLSDALNTTSRMKSTLLDRAYFSARQHLDAFFQCCFNYCQNLLTSSETKAILEMKGQFDLLIMESFGFECMFGFISHFGLPTIGISAHGHTPWNCKQMNIPEEIAVLPLEALPYTPPMTFFQRFYNTMLISYLHIRRYLEYLPVHEAIAREVFGPNMPTLVELEKRFEIFLVNVVPVLDPPRPIPPNVIEVGCLHCRPGKTLQSDIKQFLDGATNGAVYFSLGSNVRSDLLSTATIDALVTVFAELPQRVLWKWESDDEMPGRPKNVLLAKWLPQQDVLAHHNIHVFMTHGGRLSILEGLYHGVPMLVLPVFYDQYLHAHRVEELGIGLRLDIINVTELSLRHVLATLLNTNRFRENAQHYSSVSRDQLENPLERAVFWTEHVLRHNGASHLQSSARYLAWYQLYLLDVALILTLVPLLALVFCTVVWRQSRAHGLDVHTKWS